MIKVLFVSTYDNRGGAAIATARLIKKLYEQKIIDITYWVNNNFSNMSYIIKQKNSFIQYLYNIAKSIIETKIFNFIKGQNKFYWNYNILPSFIKYKNLIKGVDIVHLHWVGNGFITTRLLTKFNKPIVWTLHDSGAFTGGCHLPHDCLGYKSDCEACPQLKHKFFSKAVLNEKKRAWSNLNITVISPSNWLANCARESTVFRNKKVVVIPNGIDTTLFKIVNKGVSREIWNLPQDKKLILFGAISSTADYNKGFNHLIDALNQLKGKEDIELLVFGASSSDINNHTDIRINYIGYLSDEVSLAVLYSAADVFVAPSLSENLPNTIMESMSCGTPVVAFSIGGIPDLIDHKINGYLAKPYLAEDMAFGIEWCIKNHEILTEEARTKINNNFSIERVSKLYEKVYKEIQQVGNQHDLS